MINLKFNEYQSSIEDLHLSDYPEEIQEQFYDFITNVPFIRNLVSVDRPRAKDLPRDEKGRAIIDICNPPILEDMDYFRPAALHFKEYGNYTELRPNPNPNSEYGKWIREEIRRCYEGYVRESDGMWVTGDEYFFLNYWPIAQTKLNGESKKGERVIDFPEVWEGINLRCHYIEQAINGGLYDPNGGNNGCEISSRGKAHPYSQVVYTPNGKTTWGSIKVGDYLFGDDGKLTKVIDIPFDDKIDVYKITFKDKRVVYASADHLWKVWRQYSHCYKIMSTKEMLNDYVKCRKVNSRNTKGREFMYRVPRNKGVDWKYKNTLIDPYTFGLLLGDGCFRHKCCYYTQALEDFEIEKVYIPYEITKWNGYLAYRIHIPNWLSILKDYGLYYKKSEEKFIPDEYKFNSRDVRLNILQGLMDSDGSVDSNGIPIIGVSSKQLADDIAFIARSLGYNCLQSIKPAGYKKDKVYKKCLDNYIVRIYTDEQLFKLPRKKNLVTKFESNYSRSNRDFSTIVNIEYSHIEQCKCVTVDNESNCYLIGDFITTHNSKSYLMSAMIGKRFVLGESFQVNKLVKCMATAYQKQYLNSDGILNKFQAGIDFLAVNTQFPKKRIKSSLQDMSWVMGYYDLDTGTQRGTLNEVIGVSAKDDISKVRGKRLNLIVVEEFGSFRNVLQLYNILIPSIQEGNISFGTLYLIGTAGDDESDFQGAQEIVYNPKGYRMYALPNVFDKEGQSKPYITFFFPGYMNRKGCYDGNGNSDVTKAILEILVDRYRVKYNSSDINSITKTIAEIPITPQEAILRTRGNLFPITEITQRLTEIDSNPSFYDDVYVGDLVLNSRGEVEFIMNKSLNPIRDFPTKDNTVEGALEIYEMPQKINDKVPYERYIASLDNYENDQAESMSLGSMFVLDLWTDRIVAEYTGRPMFADDLNEKFRLLCMFYNAKGLIENNKKNTFAYFSRMTSLHLLADTPEYLKSRQILKAQSFGNSSKGVPMTVPIRNFAFGLVRDWLLKPVTISREEEGQVITSTIPNLFFIKDRALLKEMSVYNPDGNFDRIMSLCQLMIYREEKMILYQGDMSKANKKPSTYLGNDPFFKANYDERFGIDANTLNELNK